MKARFRCVPSRFSLWNADLTGCISPAGPDVTPLRPVSSSRKKSSSKKTPLLEPDPFRSPPSVPSLDFKLPSSDFRSSRILPE